MKPTCESEELLPTSELADLIDAGAERFAFQGVLSLLLPAVSAAQPGRLSKKSNITPSTSFRSVIISQARPSPVAGEGPILTTTLIPTGVDRDRLVRVLQNLFGNAERPSEQKPPSEPETTVMKGTQTSSSGSPTVPPLADASPPDLAEERSTYGSSSRAGTRERPGSDPELTTADGVSGSSIEQLREIIFGAQLREYERRFARMEARLSSDLAEIREEVRARFTALEQHVRDEFESVAVELRATQQSRAVEEKRLSESIIDVGKKADDRIAALADQVTSETRDLRVQLREQTKAITDDVERRHAELLELQERDAAELRDGKADRTDLSALFMEVALRLRGESVIPEAGGSGRD